MRFKRLCPLFETSIHGTLSFEHWRKFALFFAFSTKKIWLLKKGVVLSQTFLPKMR
jgi:hypothetical protein|tara:strand:- start:438 stop:605 length:168 start_codon:yes stop_codon:yes gene_type:complete